MTKYVILLVVLIGAGGLFLYATQIAEAPTEAPSVENPFGEGVSTVGSFDDDSGEANEVEDINDDSQVPTGGTQIGGTAGSSQTTTITRAELAKHNSQTSCWVGYKGVVYDITSWLPRHPGGIQAIVPYCGTAEEFTAAFNRQHGTTKEGRLKQEGTVEGTLGN